MNRNDTGKNKKKIKPSNERVKVFEDEKPSTFVPLETRATQTEIDEDHADKGDEFDDLAEADREALELMSGDHVPENYWKLLAEERRNALNDTLEENEQLHKEVDSLKEENEKLSDLASKAEYLSGILQSVISDEEDNDSVDDEDYKTGDEQLLDDTNYNTVEVCDSDSDSDSSVYSAAASNFTTTNTAQTNTTDSESSDGDSQSSDSTKSENSIVKRVRDITQRPQNLNRQSQRFSGEWVNVELDEEKVASTEIIKGDVLATLKEDERS